MLNLPERARSVEHPYNSSSFLRILEHPIPLQFRTWNYPLEYNSLIATRFFRHEAEGFPEEPCVLYSLLPRTTPRAGFPVIHDNHCPILIHGTVLT